MGNKPAQKCYITPRVMGWGRAVGGINGTHRRIRYMQNSLFLGLEKKTEKNTEPLLFGKGGDFDEYADVSDAM